MNTVTKLLTGQALPAAHALQAVRGSAGLFPGQHAALALLLARVAPSPA